MAAAGDIRRIHHLILVEHPRAQQAMLFYVNAFNGQLVTSRGYRAAESQHDLLIKRGYVQIGDLGRHVILEIVDTARERTKDGNHPQNQGLSGMCIFDDQPLALYKQALHFGGIPVAQAQGDGQNMLYKFRDPYGYVWFISSRGFLPQPVQQLVPRRCHYLLLVPHVHYNEARMFYPAALGAQIIFEDKIFLTGGELLGRAYLMLGPPGFQMIIQLVDTFREPDMENRSEEMLFLYGNDVDAVTRIIDQFVNAGGQADGPHQQGDGKGYGNTVLHRYRDPFGYYWSIGNMALLPNELNG